MIMKGKMKLIIAAAAIALLIAPSALEAASVTIESPRGGFTTRRIQEVKGSITGYAAARATLVMNGIPQTIPVTGGRFSVSAVVSPGVNIVEVSAGDASDRVSFYAQVAPRDVKVVLTWDTPTDVDLWVIDPRGEKCFYAHRSTKSGGNLDVDITAGFGPETFSMATALPGVYSVQVQYYSSHEAPVTRVNVYVVLNEGGPREERSSHQFVMTKEHQVYHITQFQIEGE